LGICKVINESPLGGSKVLDILETLHKKKSSLDNTDMINEKDFKRLSYSRPFKMLIAGSYTHQADWELVGHRTLIRTSLPETN